MLQSKSRHVSHSYILYKKVCTHQEHTRTQLSTCWCLPGAGATLLFCPLQQANSICYIDGSNNGTAVCATLKLNCLSLCSIPKLGPILFFSLSATHSNQIVCTNLLVLSTHFHILIYSSFFIKKFQVTNLLTKNNLTVKLIMYKSEYVNVDKFYEIKQA